MLDPKKSFITKEDMDRPVHWMEAQVTIAPRLNSDPHTYRVLVDLEVNRMLAGVIFFPSRNESGDARYRAAALLTVSETMTRRCWNPDGVGAGCTTEKRLWRRTPQGILIIDIGMGPNCR